jgi:multisubunit Na+/H+ antiporter MnhF subunit
VPHMLAQVLAFVLSISLGIHVALIAVSVYRVWRGENLIDRLIGADLVTTLILAILVLIAVTERNALYIDVALGLAALGFVGAIALAKYVADERMF